MIYFIKSAAFANNDGYINLYKAGYAKDFTVRDSYYQTENPTRVVINEVEEATLEDEQALHQFLRNNFEKYKSGEEWYVGSKEIDCFMRSVTLEDIQSLPRKKSIDYDEIVGTVFGEKLSSVELYWSEKTKLEYIFIKNIFYDGYLSSNLLGSNPTCSDRFEKCFPTDTSKSLFSKFLDRKIRISPSLDLNDRVEDEGYLVSALEILEDSSIFAERIKTLCDIDEKLVDTLLGLVDNDDEVVKYFKKLGKDRCIDLGYSKRCFDEWIIKEQQRLDREAELAKMKEGLDKASWL